MPLSDAAYARLLTLRTGLRHFEAWSGRQARSAGLTPAQHQLLLAIRGHADPEGPTVGEVADYLLLRHHSAVGLVDRAEAAGLVQRTRSHDDHRVVRLGLTDRGASRLETLSALHLEELHRLALDLPHAWAGLGPVHAPHGFGPADEPQAAAARASFVDIARVHDRPDAGSARVLVDRLWPRGVAREGAPFDEWAKEVAPSTALRRWYGHDPGRFSDFAHRYREELAHEPARSAAARLRTRAKDSGVVLVTAAKDLDRSAATVLKQVLTTA